MLELLKRLIDSYDGAKPKETAARWIDELFPDDLRKEVLPDYLYNVLTTEFLADIFLKDYVVQINQVAKTLQSVSSPKLSDIDRVQQFVIKELETYKNPACSKNGLTGFGGFVKDLESVFAGLVVDDHFPAKEYINLSIAQIMTRDGVKHLLDKQFLSMALTHALPSLQKSAAANLPTDVEQQCVESIANILFPNGKGDLPIPEMARALSGKS